MSFAPVCNVVVIGGVDEVRMFETSDSGRSVILAAVAVGLTLTKSALTTITTNTIEHSDDAKLRSHDRNNRPTLETSALAQRRYFDSSSLLVMKIKRICAIAILIGWPCSDLICPRVPDI